MKAVVKKWGNSASLRILSSVMQAARLKLDQPVDVREEEGRVIIEPLHHKEYVLTELLRGITRANQHEETDFGRRVGKEGW